MLYRKYKAIAYEDRLCKNPPFDGLETDDINQLYKYMRDNAKYNLTYEVIFRDRLGKMIFFPEQINDAQELYKVLTKFEEEPE